MNYKDIVNNIAAQVIAEVNQERQEAGIQTIPTPQEYAEAEAKKRAKARHNYLLHDYINNK